MSARPRHLSRHAAPVRRATIATMAAALRTYIQVLAIGVPVSLSGGLFFHSASHASTSASSLGAVPIEVAVKPLSGFRVRYSAERVFGGLEWLGGVELSSSDPRFGGFSGLLSLDAGGRILAVSDRGVWFSATVRQGPDGEPLGVEGAMIAPILDERGTSLEGKHSGDAEALTLMPDDPDAGIFVSFEQQHRVLGWRLTPTMLETRARRIATAPDIEKLVANKGLEALAASALGGPLKGALVAIAERDPAGGDSNPGWLFGKDGVQRFQLRQRDDYDVTDATFLPDGDLLVLERRFNLQQGLGMRLRRVAKGALMRGGLLEGSLLMEADLRHQIDNMEGLAVHQSAAGDTIVTLISDDNQLVLQRTVLLRFRLLDAEAVAPALPPQKP